MHLSPTCKGKRTFCCHLFFFYVLSNHCSSACRHAVARFIMIVHVCSCSLFVIVFFAIVWHASLTTRDAHWKAKRCHSYTHCRSSLPSEIWVYRLCLNPVLNHNQFGLDQWPRTCPWSLAIIFNTFRLRVGKFSLWLLTWHQLGR